LSRYSQRNAVGASGPALSGAEGAEVAMSGVEKAAKAAIIVKTERPRVKRVVSLRQLDGVMGNLL
jgi:hypothetical protein